MRDFPSLVFGAILLSACGGGATTTALDPLASHIGDETWDASTAPTTPTFDLAGFATTPDFASVYDFSSNPALTVNCASLSSCCATLSSQYQTDCTNIVSADDDADCANELNLLTTDGNCGGGGVADAGAGGFDSGLGLGACDTLEICCLEISSVNDQNTCLDQYEQALDDAQCASYLVNWQAECQ